jgi:hypothetical protein
MEAGSAWLLYWIPASFPLRKANVTASPFVCFSLGVIVAVIGSPQWRHALFSVRPVCLSVFVFIVFYGFGLVGF